MRNEILERLDKRKSDLHTHTHFCDGKDSPEDMVISAIERGLSAIGIAHHSSVSFDRKYSIAEDEVPRFKSEVMRLREKYKDKILVLCGIERDYYTTFDEGDFDYTIGSAHYLKIGKEYLPFDQSRDNLIRTVNEKFDGDYFALAKEYYRMVSEIKEVCSADIVGHFDLISKFNHKNSLFNEGDEKYLSAAKAAAKKLVGDGLLFEVNTGAISRGYTDKPYPGSELYSYIRSLGGEFILSSDAHQKENIAYKFEEFSHLI